MKEKVTLIVLVLIVIAFSVVACGGVETIQTDNGQYVTKQTDVTLYHVDILMATNDSYSTLNGSGNVVGLNGYTSGSMSIWEDGKGMVRGELVSVAPQPDWVTEQIEVYGDNLVMVVKTTDRKATMGQVGDLLHLVCLADYEPVCADVPAGEKDVCETTWEFDYCRLIAVEKFGE